MLLRTYVREYPSAKHNDPCSICGNTVLNQPIYWHGYGANDPVTGTLGHHGLATHKGCFWDERNGPAPYLTWGQIAALNNALVGRAKPESAEADRLLSAIARALRVRPMAAHHGDEHVALRLGPDLVKGYEMVLTRLDRPEYRFWKLRDDSGEREWEAVQVQMAPLPVTGPALSTRQSEQSRRLAMARQALLGLRTGSPVWKRALVMESHQLSILGIEVRMGDEAPEYRWKGGAWRLIPEDTRTIHGIQPVAKEAGVR